MRIHVGRNNMGDSSSRWRNTHFWCWGIAGAIGNGGGAAGIDVVSAGGIPVFGIFLAALTSGAWAAGGGFVAGAGGYGLSYWLDEPDTRWNMRACMLFGIIFSLLIFSLIAFPALGFLERHPEAHNTFVFVVSLIAGLIPPGFSGILNNLQILPKIESDYRDDSSAQM
jgi:hypothetical protein